MKFENNFEINLQKIKERSLRLKAVPLDDKKFEKITELLKQKIKKRSISYLEVGSGIGYSFLNFLRVLNIKEAVLIEKDKERFEELKKNVKNFKNRLKIDLINDDALNYLKKLEKSFDIVLVDANKSKYLDYFLLLKEKSKFLIFDNTFFNDLTENERFKTIIKNLKLFHEEILKSNSKEIIHYKIKDGITIVIF